MRGGQGQLDRDAALHVRGAAAVQDSLARHAGGPVGRDGAQRPLRDGQRHRVQVPGQDDPLRPAQVCAGDDGVAVADQLQLRDGAQGRLHGVGQLRLVPGHAVDVDDGGGQQGNVLAEVQAGRLEA